MKVILNITKKLTEEATTQADNLNSGMNVASPAVIDVEDSPIMIAEAPSDFKLKEEKVQDLAVKSKRKTSPEIIEKIEEEDAQSLGDDDYRPMPEQKQEEREGILDTAQSAKESI